MNLTPQQQTIVDHVKNTTGLTMVSAIAGSGKTTLLTAIAEAVNPKTGLYLAYNKSVATEASRKFPKAVHCCTTHSLAFKPIVTANKLKLGTFNAYSIKEPIHKSEKFEIIDLFKEFCVSKYLSFEDFGKAQNLLPEYISIGTKYFTYMQEGRIDITHDFYLKQFHICLADGSCTYDPFDLIMLDEAGDLNEVTLEIFNLLPATNKIMVGDPHQNIYGFNHTVNCFEIMKSHGTTLPMSQSFRVSETIAERIEKFCHKYLDPDMDFKGVPLRDSVIETRAFISRTNAGLIGKMMELNELGVAYGLTRKAQQIFSLPLAICGLKPNGFITAPEYKHLQADVDEYYENLHLYKADYGSLFAYLLSIHGDDVQLTNTIKLIQRYGKAAIINCYEEARKHEKTKQSYMLGTAHSMKGLEADEVTIGNDLNEAVLDAINFKAADPDHLQLPEEFLTELNLYYVAISRARKILIGAKHI